MLQARGSERARKNPDEPKPERCKPTGPRHLSKQAKKQWKAVVDLLDAMRVLTRADLVLVERYCEILILWRQCRDHIAENGLTYPLKKWHPLKDNGTDGDGKPNPRGGFEIVGYKEFPQAKLLKQYDIALLQHERELGLTPSARTRLAAVEAPDDPGRPPGTREDRKTPASFSGPVLHSSKGAG